MNGETINQEAANVINPVSTRTDKPVPRYSTAKILGMTSIILGCFAMLFAWIPVIGLFSLPVSIIGLVLSFIGIVYSIFDRLSRIKIPVLGAFLCFLSIVITILVSYGSLIGLAIYADNENEKNLTNGSNDFFYNPKSYVSDNVRNYDIEIFDIKSHQYEALFSDSYISYEFKIKNLSSFKNIDTVIVQVFFLDKNNSVVAYHEIKPLLFQEQYNTKKNLSPNSIWSLKEGDSIFVGNIPDQWEPGNMRLEIIESN